MKWNAVLFDLDGVLVDTYHCWWSLLNEALQNRGLAPLTQSEFDPTWGQGPEADQQMFFPGKSVPEVLHYYEEVFPRHVHLMATEEGAQQCLKDLKERGVKLGVASNSPMKIVEASLRQAGLYDFLHAVAGVDLVKLAKPAPDLILLLLELLQVNRNEAIYVGDSIFDLEAAKAAGVLFVGYKRPGDLSIRHFSELPALL